MNLKHLLVSGLLALLLTGCSPLIEVPTPDAGEVDFTTYVAIGGSFTGGYADGALHRQGQLRAYPAMLAQKFQLVGGHAFKQPLVPDDVGFDWENGQMQPRLVLDYVTSCDGTTDLLPARMADTPTPENLDNIAAEGPFHNFGIPGLQLVDLTRHGMTDPQVGNVYYARFADDTASTILAEVLERQPSFFTLWIGLHDVLDYALSGGKGARLTSPEQFTPLLDDLALQLTADSAKGAIANIPDVLFSPWFRTIPYNALDISADTAALLNFVYSGSKEIEFAEGPNPFVIEDNGVTRQLGAGEFVLLSVPQDSLRCAGWGSLAPLADRYVLDSAEISHVRQVIAFYNQAIKQTADKYDLAWVNINCFYEKLDQGIRYNGIDFHTELAQGAFFSLDGLQPSDRGQALLANEFIRAINKHYHASLPEVDVTAYNGVLFP